MSDVVERYLLVKRGLYYRPDNQGYTGLKREAGRYPASRASEINKIYAVHEDEAGEFAPACWQETKLAERDAEITRLRAELASAVAAERERCARAGYRVCAETRHVTLGDKVEAAIRNADHA